MGECVDYDVRLRPWYTAGSGGGKNIILMMDVSASMANEGRIDSVKEATKTIIDTLSSNDFVGVIAFSTTAKSLLNNNIRRATSVFKEELKSTIDDIKVGGETNY